MFMFERWSLLVCYVCHREQVASHDVKGREKYLYCHRGSRVAMRIPARNEARASGDTCLEQSGLCLAEADV